MEPNPVLVVLSLKSPLACRDACSGDSGGPLVVVEGGGGTLVGVVSGRGVKGRGWWEGGETLGRR